MPADLVGHAGEGLRQRADLVLARQRQRRVVASGGDRLGRALEAAQGAQQQALDGIGEAQQQGHQQQQERARQRPKPAVVKDLGGVQVDGGEHVPAQLGNVGHGEELLAAVEAGKRVLLANKEALVMSGALFMQAVKRSGAVLLPIDSEHNAIFQSLPRNYADGLERVGVRRILLTASGGPFRETPLEQLASVTPEQACAHPNWSMGRKISVDSASMMNKGLELIEACWLFDAQPSQVEVVIHPQSVIHSMVDYVDGSVIAQLGNPDMRTPISYAMAWPERIDSGVSPLDMFAVGRLDFQRPDEQRFPCLRLASQAAETGGSAPAMLNAANEVAVAAFLERRIRFSDIAVIIEDVLNREAVTAVESLDQVLAADRRARSVAGQWLTRHAG
ncbi:1-deoxy-D-xylulose-5-phosphate reductoisomerase [Pseudomonas aeruginosa]|nr:1-deoxy-D-xylulose-5-phosphate reductoisomerase [Pseudomonas aeruginosa]MBF3214560.1 1-deoxy-D-xylulose-5-phosphate reductoisomerase [Pseudomonas aeruginosa]